MHHGRAVDGSRDGKGPGPGSEDQYGHRGTDTTCVEKFVVSDVLELFISPKN